MSIISIQIFAFSLKRWYYSEYDLYCLRRTHHRTDCSLYGTAGVFGGEKKYHQHPRSGIIFECFCPWGDSIFCRRQEPRYVLSSSTLETRVYRDSFYSNHHRTHSTFDFGDCEPSDQKTPERTVWSEHIFYYCTVFWICFERSQFQ